MKADLKEGVRCFDLDPAFWCRRNANGFVIGESRVVHGYKTPLPPPPKSLSANTSLFFTPFELYERGPTVLAARVEKASEISFQLLITVSIDHVGVAAV